jgi:hypothetical protein
MRGALPAVRRGGGGLRDEGSETLFETIGRCVVDWDGGRGADDPYDLSRFVRVALWRSTDRDDVFGWGRGLAKVSP